MKNSQKEYDGRSYRISGMTSDKPVDPKLNEKLINQIAQAKDDKKQELAWKLASINAALIPYTIKKYFKGINHVDCMMSDGMDGLFRACMKVRKGASNKEFSSYAIKFIFGHIIRPSKERSRQVHYPDNKAYRGDVNETSLNDVVTTDEGGINDNDVLNKNIVDDAYEQVIKNSDGEYCKKFINDNKEHYLTTRNASNARGPYFYSDKCMNILLVAGNNDLSDATKILGAHRQQLEQTQQASFVYMVRHLRDLPQKERDNFFDVIYKGKYSYENPPPFDGWRKRLWDCVVNEEEGTFVPATNYTKLTNKEAKQ